MMLLNTDLYNYKSPYQINLNNPYIKSKSHKLYIYSTQTYLEKWPEIWIKVGQTEGDVDTRLNQQDIASTPEPLVLLKEYELPENISDYMVHKELEKMGFERTRYDKQGCEWFKCEVDDVNIAVNYLLTGVKATKNYILRNEQSDCVKSAVSYFMNGGTEFMINGKMRFGKVFTSYHIIKKLEKIYNRKLKVLILTYKPSVESSWSEDINDQVDFCDWDYFSGNGYEYNDDNVTSVLFSSFQDINNLSKKKWKGITEEKYDVVIIDESHYGSDTKLAQETLDQLNFDLTLYLSGTPIDALLSGKYIDGDNMYSWNYVDEQKARELEKLSGWKTEIYRWLPVMNFHLYRVSDAVKSTLDLYTDDEQFTFGKLFGTNQFGTFNDVGSVKLFINEVFGIGVRKEKSPIRMIAPDHIVMVLPPSIKSVTAYCNLLNEMVGDDYRVINVSGNNVKELDVVQRLIKTNKRTITVTAGRFNTGVTVPEWDAIFMFNDGEAPETYLQTIFRVQSSDKSRKKEKCYVFDYNPERNLKVLYQYAEISATKNQSPKEWIREFLEFAPIMDHQDNGLIRVEVDQFLEVINNIGGFVDSFSSSYIIDSRKAMGFLELLKLKGEVKEKEIVIPINCNGIKKGKNFKSNPNQSNNDIRKENSIIKIIISKVKYINKHIPEFILFVHQATNVDELFEANPEDFYEHFGITLDFFKEMVYNGLIVKDRLNRSMLGFVG